MFEEYEFAGRPAELILAADHVRGTQDVYNIFYV